MNALLRKKRIWEYQNERTLLRLVETSADVSVESVKKAGQITSFLLYLVYKTLGVMLAIARWMFQRPKLQRFITPERAAESVEPGLQQLETNLRNPFFRV
ncbi:hypothetical protein [Bdellovibrio svalbardensis]|uniref:Uncharacterized protein n=1 Tax=Bdellovibrio svalbardensis TaxID=2972972 RepID=A0ABT6DE65_9BACT|nr:hypothetical protein [Bdellovibrio svalbardensis]MDG0815122.1 hypothetical protein [Bdellovibrio svalbardensis]